MKQPFRFVLVIGLLLLAVLPITAQEEVGPPPVGLRPDAPQYALHGPYWVGTTEFVIEDEERPIPVTMWYPALRADADVEEITYSNAVIGHAILEATPDPGQGPYPLVIFSHGGGASRQVGVYSTEHLASYGFVVIALEHPGSNIEASMAEPEEFAENVVTDLVDRPHDISRVIDYAITLNETGSVLEGLIDTQSVAVTGHSFGGYTAYAAAGARLGFTGIAVDTCHNGQNPDGWCWAVDRESLLAEKRNNGTLPGEVWPDYGDQRIDAIVAMAPWLITVSDQGLQNVNVPTLTMVGSADWEALPEFNGGRGYQYIGSDQKALVTLENAFHGIYINRCDAYQFEITLGMYPYCSDAVWDIDRGHDLINHFTTAFLLDVLKGDAEAHAALAPDAVQFPGITYEAQGF